MLDIIIIISGTLLLCLLSFFLGAYMVTTAPSHLTGGERQAPTAPCTPARYTSLTGAYPDEEYEPEPRKISIYDAPELMTQIRQEFQADIDLLEERIEQLKQQNNELIAQNKELKIQINELSAVHQYQSVNNGLNRFARLEL